MARRGGVRRNDPDTSRDAANSSSIPTLRTLAFQFLCDRGEMGATKFEAFVHYGNTCPDAEVDSWSPRFIELIDRGLAEHTDARRTTKLLRRNPGANDPFKLHKGQVYRAKPEYWGLPHWLLPSDI